MSKEIENQKIASQMPYPNDGKVTEIVEAYLKKRRAKELKKFKWAEFLKRKKADERKARVRLMFPKDEE